MLVHPIRIVHISDTHLFADPKKTLLGVPTQQSMETVIACIKQHTPQMDFILHSGDLSQDATPASYERVAALLAAFSVPVYCVPGNHDSSDIMARVYPQHTLSLSRHIVQEKWHVILLDSHIPNAVEGYLATEQLTFLQRCLTDYPHHDAVIVFHHPPIGLDTAWLDPINLRNADAFWQLVSRYARVKAVLFGHAHQEVACMKGNVMCYGVPSTCIQFKPKQDKFALDHVPPGYRYIELGADGQLSTTLYRAPHYVGQFEENVTGY
ncbi:MAG TPA: 3',5'-cyclic-AMP phosphodiesterase [Gammaproteobacteria bacterium]|jgi:Icc protein|nr:3',5'-cyclic-AMP phosphodiesterase [Gammaproteobacteria bacterium]